MNPQGDEKNASKLNKIDIALQAALFLIQFNIATGKILYKRCMIKNEKHVRFSSPLEKAHFWCN
jgi:hypothetical protein